MWGTAGHDHPGQDRVTQSPTLSPNSGFPGHPGHVSGRGWPQGSSSDPSPGSTPSLAVPGGPTSPTAEVASHSHPVRTPIAIAPAAANAGSHHPQTPQPQCSPATSPRAVVTYPRSPSSVLWISFRTPVGQQRPGEANRGWASEQPLSPLPMLSTSGKQPSAPPWPSKPHQYPGTSFPSLLPACQLPP